MLERSTATFAVAIALLLSLSVTAEPGTCDEALGACDTYVQALETESAEKDLLIKAQQDKLALEQNKQQNWLFVCPNKLTCILLGTVLGALAWELVR